MKQTGMQSRNKQRLKMITKRTVKVDKNDARDASVVRRPCAWKMYPAKVKAKP